ncbi:MAG: hypothetical protein IRY99_09250 [Isosphaeraceae bacterium]|nr:hypothetical protein [Isosphaeraceae bacterium]
MRSWAFPPETREVQFDEKWAFVYKKQRNCDPANPDDDRRGDSWDYVAFDPEHKLVLVAVPEARTEENARALIAEVERRVGSEPPPLMTSDEYPAYAAAIEAVFRTPGPAPPRRPLGRPRIAPEQRLPDDVVDATVHKHRENHRVIAVEARQVYGSSAALRDLLGESAASPRVNPSFVERQNATDRHRNARKTYRPSKDWQVHEAMTDLTLYSYNFCRRVRTLRAKDEHGPWRGRSLAPAAGLTDHIWTWREWFTRPAIQAA